MFGKVNRCAPHQSVTEQWHVGVYWWGRLDNFVTLIYKLPSTNETRHLTVIDPALLKAYLFLILLDVQGKARHEAARPRNSECKINLIAEIPLAAMAVGLQPYSERWLAGGAAQTATQYERYKHRQRRPLDGRAPWRSAHFLLFVDRALVQTAKFWREKWDFFQSIECNKSEWKVNLGIRNSTRSNRSWRMTRPTYTVS